MLYDVTEFARLDELRMEMIAVASHELKTPLTTLRMNLLLLQERSGELTPGLREILATALLGSEELASTIDELLDLTRIESGQLRLSLERVDLPALIEHAVEKHRPRFEENGIKLKVENQCKSAAVRGDSSRLGVVLSNLLTNALKYTPRGGTVTVKVAPKASAPVNSQRGLEVSVTDTGPGIPIEYRERVFEKFFRLEHLRPHSSGGVQGVGIGLYLCRQIIALHGGTIACLPNGQGVGTRIVLELPSEVDPASTG
jgi:two-component system, NtrC family, sensor histidine kinase KinB